MQQNLSIEEEIKESKVFNLEDIDIRSTFFDAEATEVVKKK